MIRKKKTQLRRQIKLRLSELTAEQKKTKSTNLSLNIVEALTNLGFSPNSETVIGVFAPLNDEPVWFQEMNEWQNNMAFPIYHDNQMKFVKCRFDELVEDLSFGVKLMAPKLKKTYIDPDVLLIPGLAFSDNGMRLGRGKGFYDRYLKNYKNTKLGICFSEQLVSNIPFEEHDVKVDFVIDEKQILPTRQEIEK